jgi:hypothetical protein
MSDVLFFAEGHMHIVTLSSSGVAGNRTFGAAGPFKNFSGAVKLLKSFGFVRIECVKEKTYISRTGTIAEIHPLTTAREFGKLVKPKKQRKLPLPINDPSEFEEEKLGDCW